jgi:hypothetical protein
MRARWFAPLVALLPVAASAQTATPTFTNATVTSSSTVNQSINETIVTKTYGAAIRSVSADNVTATGDINDAATTFSVTDSTKPYSLEVVTRAAGLIEESTVTRTITTTSVVNSLSVFSQ